MATTPPQDQSHVPQARQNRNDTRDLLFLQDYAHKLEHTQQTLEEVCISLQQEALLSGIISAQDSRSLQTANSCLNSLRIRVEALANVTEQTVTTKQLQLMQERVQIHRHEDHDTDNISYLSRASLYHSVPTEKRATFNVPTGAIACTKQVGGLEP